MDEIEQIKKRYERRKSMTGENLYDRLRPSVYLAEQEKERALIYWILRTGQSPISIKKVLEIGCGSGSNLLGFIRLGFAPENLIGNELLEERIQNARMKLPEKIRLISGDASQLDLPEESLDIVYQSTVFTSILDSELQKKIAYKIWRILKPGGGVLWYDFIYDNPANKDVRGVPVARIRNLFPEGRIDCRKLTLAPPISRRVTRIHPFFYHIFNLFPVLRTHVFCWIEKPLL
jgi:ubiquinone/menaquinone biosynthesis C-methylase UbiE